MTHVRERWRSTGDPHAVCRRRPRLHRSGWITSAGADQLCRVRRVPAQRSPNESSSSNRQWRPSVAIGRDLILCVLCARSSRCSGPGPRGYRRWLWASPRRCRLMARRGLFQRYAAAPLAGLGHARTMVRHELGTKNTSARTTAWPRTHRCNWEWSARTDGRGIVRRLDARWPSFVGYTQRDPSRLCRPTGCSAPPPLQDFAANLDKPRGVWVMFRRGDSRSTMPPWPMCSRPGDGQSSRRTLTPATTSATPKSFPGRASTTSTAARSGGMGSRARRLPDDWSGDREWCQRLSPLFASIAPGLESAPRRPGRDGAPSPSEQGSLHCRVQTARATSQDGP